MEIVWKPSFSASCFHAADAVRRGAVLADPRWEPLRPSVDQLATVASRLPRERFWRLAAALAGEHSSNRELSERILAKLGGPNDLVAPLQQAIDSLENAVARVDPQLESRLAPRVGPLREQWEARGPGFLRALEASLGAPIASRAVVYVVHPLAGGDGTAHLWFNSVSIEGVLYNTTSVPETVRLGWLLAQLQFDLPAVSEQLGADALPRLARWAALPAAVQAAQQVEWLGTQSLAELLVNWRLSPPEDAGADAQAVEQWWDGARGQTWPRRLAALRETFLDL